MSSPKVGYFYERITESGRHILSQVRGVEEPQRNVEGVEVAQWTAAGVWEPLLPCVDVLDFSLWRSQVEKAKLAQRRLRVRVIPNTMIEVQSSRGVVYLVAIRQVINKAKLVRIHRIATRVSAGVWRPLQRNGLIPLKGLRQQAHAAAAARQEEMRTT